MSRNIVLHVAAMVLLGFALSNLCIKVRVMATNGFRVHNLDTGLDYETMQSAIDAPQTKDGHRIRVDAGVYDESVSISKMLSLVGDNAVNTNIKGYVGISASNISISRFNITGRVSFASASADCTFSQNILSYDGQGDGALYLRGYRNIIQGNTIRDCPDVQGIYSASAYQCIIVGNEICNNDYGVFLRDSNFFNITQNSIHNNSAVGLVLIDSDNSLVAENSIYSNALYAIQVSGKNSMIYHNDFFNNGKYAATNKQARGGDYSNFWDDGKEGNYWDDYDGKDEDKDGVGDTPYVVDSHNRDSFPLMKRFIPEFPSILVLPLLAMATLFAAIICKRKNASTE